MHAGRGEPPGPTSGDDMDTSDESSRAERQGRTWLDRRAWIARAAATIAAGGLGPVILPGCRRDEEPAATDPSPGPPLDPAPTPVVDAPPFPPTSPPDVSVRIARVDPADGPLVAIPTGTRGRIRVHVIAPDGSVPDSAVLPGPLRIERTEHGWRLVDGMGEVHDRLAARDEWLRMHDAEGPGGLRLRVPTGDADAATDEDPPPRLGTLEFLVDDERPGRLHVIEHLPIETYLPGVLDGELPASWHPEAFAALAVAARTFAAFQVIDRAARGHRWALESDTRSQMFVGGTAPEVALDAVARTEGMVLLAGGRIFPAYYSSTCGGLGAAASGAIADTVANRVSPLEGHRLGSCCSAAPRYRWTASRTPERAGAQLAARGRSIDDEALASIGPVRAITEIGAHWSGRPARYRIEDTRGHTAEIDAPDLRWALTNGRRRGEDRVHSGWIVRATPGTGGQLVLAGRGWGHGVGLCQYGAQAMARRGKAAADILTAYYPGAERARPWSTERESGAGSGDGPGARRS